MREAEREKTFNGKTRLNFKELFESYLKSLGMTWKEFRDAYSIQCEEDIIDKDFAIILCDMRRMFPLRAIKVLTDKLEDGAEEAIEKLLSAWFMAFGNQRKKRMDIFQFIPTSELAWITTNMSKLLSLSDNSIIFRGYMDMLNENGLNELYEGIRRICTELDIALCGKGDFLPQFEEVNIYKDIEECKYRTRLEYLLKIEKSQVWNIKSVKRREDLLECWNGFQYMYEGQEELMNLFLCYESDEGKTSFEQQIFLRKIRILIEDDRYVKAMYKRGCK